MLYLLWLHVSCQCSRYRTRRLGTSVVVDDIYESEGSQENKAWRLRWLTARVHCKNIGLVVLLEQTQSKGPAEARCQDVPESL